MKDASVSSLPLAISDSAHEQPVPYGAIADDRLALDDFHEHIKMVIGEDHADMLTYRGGISTDTDKVPIAVHAN